jgi:ubiquinone biosynthesis protein Coq4
MTTREALNDYLGQQGIKAGDQPFEEWLHDNWLRMSLFGHRIPVKPLHGFKNAVVLHDVHHLIADYDTTWTGEFQVAAWELGSGGCGSPLLFSLKLVFLFLLGLVLAPTATCYAFGRGRSQRNLYRFEYEEVLPRDIDELRRYVASDTR